jgi:D-alanine-D-alanine ligase
MKVLVIGGGISDEREVSLRSAKAVAEAGAQYHDVELYDWDGSRDWLAAEARQFDVAFPVLHGKGGEDGQIQQILEGLGVAYVGTDSEHSAICMDKIQTNKILAQHGILVPKGELVDLQEYKAHTLYDKPHVLKPLGGGSSIDTFVFSDVSKRSDTPIAEVFKEHEKLMLEEYISGQEITVSILDGHDMPVIEIIPPANGIFDYENKYNGTSQELCPPEHVSQKLQIKAKELAQKCHDIMGCRDLSRTDMIIHGNELVVLEINTIPGMTSTSLFPKAAAVAGLSMDQLVDFLVNSAAKRGAI